MLGRILTHPSQGGFLEARLRRGAPGRRDTGGRGGLPRSDQSILVWANQLFNRSRTVKSKSPESKVDFRLG